MVLCQLFKLKKIRFLLNTKYRSKKVIKMVKHLGADHKNEIDCPMKRQILDLCAFFIAFANM